MHTQQPCVLLVRKWVLVLAVIVAMPLPAIAQSSGGSGSGADEAAALRSYHTGNGLLNRGMHELAAREYRTFLREQPEHEKAPTARYGLGVCLYRLKDHRGAIEQLRIVHAVDDFPFAADVIMLLGRSHLAVGEPAEAAAYFGALVEQHRTHQLADDATALQVESLYQAGSFDALHEPARMYVRRWPSGEHRERVELFWGLAEFAAERFDQAADRFTAMRERFGSGQYADQTVMLLAKSLHRARQLERASAVYHQVLENKNELYVPEALYGLAAIRHQDGDLNEAARLLEQFMERYVGHGLTNPAHLLAGRIAFDQQAYAEAQRHFQVLSRAEDAVLLDDASYWLAKCELRLGRPEAAEQRLVSTLNTFVESELRGQMLHDLAVARLRQEKPGEAAEALQQFITQMRDHPLEAEVTYLLAVAEHDQGNYAASASWCERFDEKFAEAHQLRGAVAFLGAENAFLQDDIVAAERAYRSFLEKYPADDRTDDARYRLGLTLHQQEKYTEARPFLLESASAEDDGNDARRTSAMLALADGYFQNGSWNEAARMFGTFIATSDDRHASLPEALLKQGLALHRQEQYAPAIASYDRYLQLYGDGHALSVQVMFERGQTLVVMGENDRAEEMFRRVIAAGDDSRFAVHARGHLATIAMQDGRYDEAARYSGEVAARSTDKAQMIEAVYRQARAELSGKRYADAAKNFAQVIAEHGDPERVAQAAAYEVIAVARSGDHAAALALMESVERRQMTQLDDRLRASLLYEKAWCERNSGEPNAAMETYERIAKIENPGSIALNARVELADLLMNASEYERAADLLMAVQEDIAEDRREFPEVDEVSLYGLGMCQLRLEKFEEAAKTLEELIDRHGDSARISSARLLCAQAMYESGSVQLAVGQLTRIIEDHPDSEAYGGALLRQGEYLATLQHWRRSEEAFAAYLKAFPDSELWFQARFGIGWARENAGDHPAAIASYQQVIDRHDGATAARAQFQIGECYFAMNEHETAIAELLKVDILYAYPQWSAAALYEAGRCFEKLGKSVDARKQYQSVVERFEESQWAKLAQGRLEHLAAVTLPGHGG